MTTIAARHKGYDRAVIVDENFTEYVHQWAGEKCHPDKVFNADTGLDKSAFIEIFESQLRSRHLDLMARVLRRQNKVFYTIGSSGHEGNAMLARLTRHTDPAFLHYRAGAFMMERSRQVKGIDPVYDTALSFAASSEDPASGGRHKVWGSKPLWVLPQTSTIASHLPKAFGTAIAIEQGKRLKHQLPIPDDSISICTFGDASSNHATAQSAFNAAQWSAHQKLPAPVLFVCEDNGIGISVKTPKNWIASNFKQRPGMDYFFADSLDMVQGYADIAQAVEHCRHSRRPTFLHLRTTRLMGHAGTDFEIEWRTIEELVALEATDPLLRSADIALQTGIYTQETLLAKYEEVRKACFTAADKADKRPKLATLDEISAPLAPFHADQVKKEARREVDTHARHKVFGKTLPEDQTPKHMAILINQGLHDVMLKYPQSLLFGEDVAQKGGVYTLTRGLQKAFRGMRVFNTLLDETTILGLAQGFANMGFLPIPEIQYLAYLHNAADQVRGEAATLQFFSNGQYRNPMLIRIASLGYQRGFGGHFHNDNSIAAIRDIPGLIVACPSRGDDAVRMLRTLAALAMIDGRVCVFLEPIALYMTKDLYAEQDGKWQFAYPPEGEAITLGEGRVYEQDADELVIFTYANGVPMSLRAARKLEQSEHIKARIVDLRWLAPLNEAFIAAQAATAKRILIVDEGRHSAGVSEGIISAINEAGFGATPLKRVVGADTFTPLAGAAFKVLPSDQDVYQGARALLGVDE